MQYLLVHGTSSLGKILESNTLRGGSKLSSLAGAKSSEIGGTAPPDKIFFAYMDIAPDTDYAAEIVTPLSYARKQTKIPDVRGLLFFSPKYADDGAFRNQGQYGTVTSSGVPLADLDLQIVVFAAEDLPKPPSEQDPLKSFLAGKNFFTPNPTLTYYPATMPVANFSNPAAFNPALAKIISSAKSFGFCYTYDAKGKVLAGAARP